MDNPLVSVIVPTKNSAEFLWDTLASLKFQTYKNKEVIVVDNFSTDETLKIAQEMADKVCLKGPERASQDNYGIRIAKGSIIWLTGSDMIADDDYIEEGVKKIKEGYDAVYASVVTHNRVRHFWGKVKSLERKCYIGDDVIESARFFKKSVWVAVGGFDEQLVQVEEDFQHKLDSRGYHTGRTHSREYHLHEENSLKSVFKKSRYYGQYMARYLSVHRSRGIRQLLPVRGAFVRNWRLLVAHPILTTGLIIYKCVQYGGGLCGLRRSRSRGQKGL